MGKYFDILYEDDWLIVINKQAGVLSIPDRFKPELINLQSVLQKRCGEIFPVHRLDKDTSGIICFAKTAEAHRHLSIQFENRTISKNYHAIVHGIPIKEESDIDLKILIPQNKNKVIVSTKGKDALSKYRIVQAFRRYALLEIELITGRKHQIRAHLSHIGHPIVADEKYGHESAFYLSSIKRKKYHLKKYEVEIPLINRQMLHAYKIRLLHPLTEEALEIEADYPKDFNALFKQLNKLDRRD